MFGEANCKKDRVLNCQCECFLCCLQLRAGCISPLKNLRRLGILRILDFFDGFDSYSFSPDELDAVFRAVVWPQVCLANNSCVVMWVFIVVGCIVHAFLAQRGDKICFGQVCRLPTESPYSPTPLLKLIHVWCKNARSASILSLFHSLHNCLPEHL